jgi:hypothetical protein
MFRRASDTGRSASQATDTVSRSVSGLGIGARGAPTSPVEVKTVWRWLVTALADQLTACSCRRSHTVVQL